jgi:acetylornithine deacetylase/succinyl-diaminopimelate desuccinylase-like protein
MAAAHHRGNDYGGRMKSLMLVMILLAESAVAASPREVALQAREWRVTHEAEILAEFESFLALPNVAANLDDIERNAAALEKMFARRGLKVRLLRIEGAPPLVVADLPGPRNAPTISFYAHYDGQPVEPSKWQSEPWTAVMLDEQRNVVSDRDRKPGAEWRIQARSASDDKGPIIALLAAVDALRAAKLEPAANIRFVFDGEEEAGSPHLAEYFRKFGDSLRTDAWMVCDGPVHQSRRMQLLFGVRGTTDLQITVYGASRPLHSGHYGNWAPNPLAMLTRLLAGMRDDDGRILIPGFYDDVRAVTAAERAAIERAPRPEEALARELALGRTEQPNLNEAILGPALNIRGLSGGAVGAATSNTIHTEATASIDFRLVPAQTPQRLRERVEAFVRSQGYFIVHDVPSAEVRSAHPRVAKLDWGEGGYPAARTDMSLPISQRLIRTVEEATGRPPVVLPTLGGSVPMYLLEGPAVIVPIVNHDNNQHAANETLRLQNLWDGIEIFTALFATLR